MPLPESPAPATIRVFTRPGCHLCEQLIDELLPLVRGRLGVDICDIDTRPDWKLEFGVRIPVVEYHGETVCEHRLDAAAIRAILDTLPAATTSSGRK